MTYRVRTSWKILPIDNYLFRIYICIYCYGEKEIYKPNYVSKLCINKTVLINQAKCFMSCENYENMF